MNPQPCTICTVRYYCHINPTAIAPFQFDVTNTLNDYLLEDVRVEMEESEGFSVVSYVPIPLLPYNHPKSTYTLVELTDPSMGK